MFLFHLAPWRDLGQRFHHYGGASPRRAALFPKFLFHLRQRLNQRGGTFHDKFQPCYKSPSSGFRGAAPRFCLLGTELSAKRRKNREGLWTRFLGTDRGAPLHLQYRYPRTESL